MINFGLLFTENFAPIRYAWTGAACPLKLRAFVLEGKYATAALLVTVNLNMVQT